MVMSSAAAPDVSFTHNSTVSPALKAVIPLKAEEMYLFATAVVIEHSALLK
jgi:hypothetical protein